MKAAHSTALVVVTVGLFVTLVVMAAAAIAGLALDLT